MTVNESMRLLGTIVWYTKWEHKGFSQRKNDIRKLAYVPLICSMTSSIWEVWIFILGVYQFLSSKEWSGIERGVWEFQAKVNT